MELNVFNLNYTAVQIEQLFKDSTSQISKNQEYYFILH